MLLDRKSTRLNSSHLVISYAVFCLKKKSTRLNSSHLAISYAVFCLKKKKPTRPSPHCYTPATARVRSTVFTLLLVGCFVFFATPAPPPFSSFSVAAVLQFSFFSLMPSCD